MQHCSLTYINKVEKQTRRLLAICLLALSAITARAQLSEKFTADRPLVIVSDIEFPPYEFGNTYGEATGFNIDVLHAILNQMRIPHKFVMKEWSQASQMFEDKEADLILDPIYKFNTQPYFSSRSILNYYKIKVASRKDTPPIRSFEQLRNASNVVIKSHDIASQKVMESIAPELQTHPHTAQDALAGLANGKYKYFVWGEEPLKWKIKELNLENEITINEIDIPAGEVHFVGYDSDLINRIDDQYARLEQKGELEKIHDKWFNPERIHNDTSPVAIYVTVGILLLVLILGLVNRLIRRRVKAAASKNDDLANMMQQALHMGNYYVVTYNVKHKSFTDLHGRLLDAAQTTIEQLLSHIHPDDQHNFENEIRNIASGEKKACEMVLRWKGNDTTAAQNWQYMHFYTIAELDEDGRPNYIVNTIQNITNEYEQERKESELASKYVRIFDSTLVAMSFYDKKGKLLDMNSNMCKLCEVDDDLRSIYFSTPLVEVPMLHGEFDPLSRDVFIVCHRMHNPEKGIDKFVETRILPLYEGNELQYYIVTARDITAERAMYIEQRQHDKELHQANNTIKRYEEELLYVLENSQMWVWRSDVSKQRITFSRSLHVVDFELSFEEYIANLYDDENRQQALKAFGNMEGIDTTFNITLHFRQSPMGLSNFWATTSGLPTYDEHGNVTGHYGVVRDVTPLMEAQEKLRQETNRAEDSGKLKSVFLANMTHEIRTPLNAIVGFSDLLKVIDSTEDRHEFIRIIRNNCDMLIRLINDIIEASNMNQGPLAIEADDVDWAVAFNDICQTLAQRVQEPGVEFIVDNPYKNFRTHLDKGRLQQVITNFTTNAVKYTHEGHIKVGYRYENGGIYMYCEDTGAGIPKEKQGAVFERFVKLNDYVQGTGLGLSICKSIADRCGGRIGVESEGLGHGSTFWIWIPCEQLPTGPDTPSPLP